MKPETKELSFIIKLVSIIVLTSLLSFGVLYLFMDKWVGSDYRTAFQVISASYARMNYYIIAAVLLQFVISSFVVFFLALRYSHKIAGPMYRLKLRVRQFLNGEHVEDVCFRKTDFLHEVAESFSDFFRFLEKRKKLLEEARELLGETDLDDEKKKRDLLHKIKKTVDELRQ